MSKSLPVSFRIHIPEPIEVKMVSQTIVERNAISNLERFQGLWTYVVSEDVFYYLSGGTTNDHWKPFGSVPSVIEILDEFTNERQAIISGFALKNYLDQNYVSKAELAKALEEFRNANAGSSITPEQIEKWDSIQGDYHKKINFPQPKMIWNVPFEQTEKQPALQCFNLRGQKIYGQEIQFDKFIIINWSSPTAGYVTLN
ncbi:hypothetical protein [Mongoliitalea daihaiensis]|uniref:hypothetical protein n=1 Tax=Mongoliitalea daihaiensis TaxID=2782006 RepID=UPI001F37EC68|nr:hypothetical protein [Mongoliitalea daihaiensis]UJP63981.1 hypothetical protein IPZ59_14275 [Mongoliitalea daihaiensis]